MDFLKDKQILVAVGVGVLISVIAGFILNRIEDWYKQRKSN